MEIISIDSNGVSLQSHGFKSGVHILLSMQCVFCCATKSYNQGVLCASFVCCSAEFLRGRKVGPNVEVIEATLITKDDLLAPRVKLNTVKFIYLTLFQNTTGEHKLLYIYLFFLNLKIEPSVWETFFNWLSEDDYDDDDDDEQSTQDKSIKLAGGKAKRGLRHKTIPDRKLLKKREAQHKARRVKKRWDQDKTETKAQREMVKTTKGKKRERNRADNSKSEYKGKFTESWSKRKEKK